MASLDASIAVRFDFTVKQNQTFNPLLTFVDDAGTAISLAGATVKMSVRAKHCGCHNNCSEWDSNFNQIYKQDFAPTVTGAEDNQLQFDDVIELARGNYVYDLLVVWPSGEKQYYLKGNFKVEKSYADESDN